MVPTPHLIDENLVRLYFSGGNELNQSHIGWVVIDCVSQLKLLKRVLNLYIKPGALGCFDDNGVTPSCIVMDGKKRFCTILVGILDQLFECTFLGVWQ